jgi:hypothetical protein
LRHPHLATRYGGSRENQNGHHTAALGGCHQRPRVRLPPLRTASSIRA